MLAALRPILVTLAAAVRHLAGLVSPRQLAEHTILRSKHWPAIRAAAAVVGTALAVAAITLGATVTMLADADRFVWS